MDEQAKLLDCDDVIREQLALCEARLKTVLVKRDELDAESQRCTEDANKLRGMRARYMKALGLKDEPQAADKPAAPTQAPE